MLQASERTSNEPETPKRNAAQLLFDVRGAVDYLKEIGATGATINFVRGLISSRQLPYIRIGKKFCIKKAAIDSWLSKSERRAGS